MSHNALIIGFGYIGRRLAKALVSAGWRVTALTRSADAISAAESLGVAAWQGDLDQPNRLRIPPADNAAVFYLAPPPTEGTTDPRLANLLSALTVAPEAFIYISTTGVYGDTKGQMVTEESPVNPETDRAKRRVDAETALRRYADAHPRLRHVVLRVSGIYGPDKLPLARLQRNEPIVEDPAHPSYVNVIHADDLVDICIAAAERAPRGAIYNVSSNNPVSMASYMDVVADAARLPRPPRVSWEEAKQQISPGMLSYLSESRRISSDKLPRELGLTLRYGDLKTGVAAALAESRQSR